MGQVRSPRLNYIFHFAQISCDKLFLWVWLSYVVRMFLTVLMFCTIQSLFGNKFKFATAIMPPANVGIKTNAMPLTHNGNDVMKLSSSSWSIISD
jgi:hypothetical protein